EPVAAKVVSKPNTPGAAAGLPERDFGIDAARDPRSGVAEALATVFAPAARTVRDVDVREFLFAPFRGPPRLAASSGIPLRHEIRLPSAAALVSQAHPGEVKILVQQYPAMLPRVFLQGGIENDHAAADECRGVRRIARGVMQITLVPDCHLRAVKKLKE